MRLRHRLAPPLAAALITLICSGPAWGRSATPGEVSDLVRQAAGGNERALDSLREIDDIDGRSVDLATALRGSPREIESRLQALARGAEPGRTSGDTGRARDEARRILDERRFRQTDLPQPLRGPLETIGDWIKRATEPLGGLFDALPGDGAFQWVLAAVLVAALALVIAARLAQRRSRVHARAVSDRSGTRPLDPAEIDRAADRAEAEGDLEKALRLRFAAGLVRLDAVRAIDYRPSLTTGDVSRSLGSRDFDSLALIFDEVVYGRRQPHRDDLAAVRDGWGRVLAGVQR